MAYYVPQLMEMALKRVGFISPNEHVVSCSEHPYRLGPDNCTQRVDVLTEELRSYWMKSYVGSFGDNIRRTVRARVELATYMRERGLYIPRTAVFDGGTMIQEHVEGEKLPEHMLRDAMQSYELPGIKVLNAQSDDFILNGSVYCVDLGIFIVNDPQLVGISL